MSHNGNHNGSSYSEDLDALRHSAAHVMAKAVQRLFPGTKLGIGPTTEHGFYYDMAIPGQVALEDLPRIEDEMRRIIEADERFERFEVSREDAIRHYTDRDDNPFKREIVEQVGPDEAITFYRTGQDWIDLCRGPHVPGAGRIGAFKLTNVAGAYWRGDEKRPMLQRIYGTAWQTQQELDQYLWRLEEARKRDHRKLGRELGIFFLDDLAPGEPFWLPNGMRIIRTLEAVLLAELERRGYLEISTPSLVKKDLWEESGHWSFFREHMFRSEVEEQEYAFKPMNCPEATIVFRSQLRSYRDLPMRLAENSRLLRNERSGTLNGLLRVRQLSMDDAHIFCRPDQIQQEIHGVLELGTLFYDRFGFERKYYLSTRPEKAMGDPALWDQAESVLAEALDANHIAYELKPGEGAFYGPKIDIDIEDALGRAWQLTTIQLDFNLPERFKLEYIGEDGQPHRPVMIHRAIYGTYERFIGILVEHYAGAFPLWLAPLQAIILPIADRHLEYARRVADQLQIQGLRVQVDARSERVNYKIREAQVMKVPYMLIVGDKEAAAGTIAVRERAQGDLGVMDVDGLLDLLQARLARGD
jgi:threonyl-tRNA synthetase